ncbi:flagellar basal body P-ring formation chaperone FlgA [Alteromonadaceae bacterium BrNp21-10]|nr:flagellar basal body P-ring formation chaperone FlgA [Alteromonadaceae bacterium BrNp21-10]
MKFLLFTLSIIGIECQALEHSESQKNIMSLAEQYVTGQLDASENNDISVKTVAIDTRIDIPDCAEPFTFYSSSNALQQSNVTVKASCESSDWFLYFVVRVEETQSVVVSVNALSPGALISDEDIKVVNLDKNLLRYSTYSDSSDVVGAKVKRRLQSGQPLKPSQICYVCKGDAITIIAKSSGLNIKTAGIAQQDGNIGDQIRVQNGSSKRSINATIESANEVVVQL